MTKSKYMIRKQRFEESQKALGRKRWEVYATEEEVSRMKQLIIEMRSSRSVNHHITLP